MPAKSKIDEARERRATAQANALAAEQLRAEELELREIESDIRKAEAAEALISEVQKLEAEYGRIGEGFLVVVTPSGPVFVGKPKSAVFRAYVDAPGHDAPLVEKFCRQCILPSTESAKERFGQLLEEYPALLYRAENAATSLANRELEVIAKK